MTHLLYGWLKRLAQSNASSLSPWCASFSLRSSCSFSARKSRISPSCILSLVCSGVSIPYFLHANSIGSAIIHKCRILATFTTSASAGKTSIASTSAYPHSRFSRCRSSQVIPSCQRPPSSFVRQIESLTIAGLLAANSCTRKSLDLHTRNGTLARLGHSSRDTSRKAAGSLALSRSSCLRCSLVASITILLFLYFRPRRPQLTSPDCLVVVERHRVYIAGKPPHISRLFSLGYPAAIYFALIQ